MGFLRPILSMGCFCLPLPAMVVLGVAPASSQGVEIASDASQLPLLNDPARNVHSIRVTLDGSPICSIPHRAGLIIHPTSLFSLAYNQLPVTADLTLYPHPFYQRAFEPDQVRFVLPAQPTEVELAGAVAVTAKLGDLTYRMAISGTTD